MNAIYSNALKYFNGFHFVYINGDFDQSLPQIISWRIIMNNGFHSKIEVYFHYYFAKRQASDFYFTLLNNAH